MVYFCANGTHNPLNTTHKPNRCYVEFPHLCPKRKNEKDKENSLTKSSPTTQLSTSQALMTNLKMESLSSQVIIDCAATHHMFNQKSFFLELSEMTPFVVSTGDPSSTLYGEGIGSVSLRINGSTIELKECLYVLQISKILISLLQIFDKDITIHKLPANLFEIISQDFKITGKIADRLMVVDCNPPQSNLTTSYLWNQRLGHPSNQTLKTLVLSPLNDPCQICMHGKSTLLPFLGQFNKVNQPLECVHLDLTFAENLHDKRIKRVISVKGGEFENISFKVLALKCGFTHDRSPTATPQHNCFAERANRTILNKAKCLLIGSNLPQHYCRSSRIKRIKTFGCKAVILIPKHLQSWKFSPSGEDGILLGYENENSAYRILRIRDRTIVITRHALFAENHFPSIDSNPNSDSHSDRWIDLCEERDECINNEEILTDQGSSEVTEGAECLQEQGEEFAQDITPNDRPIRLRVVGPRHPKIINGDISQSNILPYSLRPKTFVTVKDADPISYQSALSDSHCEDWKKAISKELNSMENLKVWSVVDLQPSMKLVGTTWVFRTKRDVMNRITEYKARLCAQGFSQTLGVEYSKTFAPTGHLSSLRTQIAFSAIKGLEFQQMDFRSEFLNAPLTEDVYLSIPQGIPLDKKKVCLKLHKAIYGLKQAPLAGYNRLTVWLKSRNFKPSISDPCVFYRCGTNPVWLFLHVDNLAIFGRELSHFKSEIKKEFEVKDMGTADLMLGISICHLSDSVLLSQAHYTESLLDQYGMSKCQPVVTPIIPNQHLDKETEDNVVAFKKLNVNYRSAIGGLSYLSTATCPDISFAVSSLSQFLENPGIQHWNAFINVLRYLKGTSSFCLMYQRHQEARVVAYFDADWGNCRITRQSTTGFVILIGDCLVTWKTQKQPTVSLSTNEAEYKALAYLNTEVLWLRQFIQELNLMTI
ncbi:hypothetical protein O181_087146 [Austropuccinia psidii MF-1]|uniref:Integrase catalytic domain-containing protein n=1 Tax=Austropuccinia psidii MF-1 TaxID=1389203 RepID=A0A9Q3P508_9BASI|nr:hypothetical protein [Austropuccinia psidii MF-1]